MRTHPRTLAILAAGLAALPGCAGSSTPRQDAAPAAPPGAVDELAASYAQDMDDLAAATADPGGTPVSSRSGVFVERNPQPAPGDSGIQVTLGDAPTTPAPDPSAESAPTPPPVAEAHASKDVEALARDLARALRARAISGPTPYEDLSRVAMLESIAPGALEGLGEDAASDAPDLVAALAPSERDALRAARRTALSLAASQAADPSIAADALREAAESLEQSQVIRINTAALCRRVDGFGRYETFGSDTFLAGRTNAMIVYAEVDRFRQQAVEGAARPVQGVPAQARFSVRLTQSLNLYFAEGGLLVWRRPPQTVSDYSTSRLRDFYIIDTIELPATLSAGTYSLKVVVKDEATGQQAEAIIPITLVADPALARGA